MSNVPDPKEAGSQAVQGAQSLGQSAQNNAQTLSEKAQSTAQTAIDTAKSYVQAAGKTLGMTGNAPHGAPAPLGKDGASAATRPEDTPGAPKTLYSKAREVAEATLQPFGPIKRIHQVANGFHFYADDMSRQVEATHYCSHHNEEFRQCVLYDSDRPDARLIGVEYMISRRLFETLPQEEKKFWHSHKFEVASGSLIAPGVPQAAEDMEMQTLVDTYGKTFHTWQYDKYDLPIGPPQLMMAFTEDGQLDCGLRKARDARLGIDSSKVAEHRQKTLKFPEHTHPEADQWTQNGQSWQCKMEQSQVKGFKK